jgi:hypothetical protein
MTGGCTFCYVDSLFKRPQVIIEEGFSVEAGVAGVPAQH